MGRLDGILTWLKLEPDSTLLFSQVSIAVGLAGFACILLLVLFVLINKYGRRSKFGMKGKSLLIARQAEHHRHIWLSLGFCLSARFVTVEIVFPLLNSSKPLFIQQKCLQDTQPMICNFTYWDQARKEPSPCLQCYNARVVFIQDPYWVLLKATDLQSHSPGLSSRN